LIFAAALMFYASAMVHAQSISRGKQIVESRCFACHSLDFNRVGPALRGVVGRAAGKADGFEYSAALAAATNTWDLERIKNWLTNPELLVPGQRMNYQLDLKEDRDDVVAYLANLDSTKEN
jgi:cytochrome c